MEHPEGFQKLVKSFDPRNLNLMPAADIIKALSLLRDAMSALEKCADSDYWQNNRHPCQSGFEAQRNYINELLIRYRGWS